MAALPAIQIIQDPAQTAAVLQPGRLKILESLREPDSAAGLARKLGLPRQKVNYHLRELEHHGLLALVEERRKGNCVERLVRATAHTYLISPAVLGALGDSPASVQDRFSLATLIAGAARAIRDLAILRGRADRAGKRLATLSLQADVRFASAEHRHQFGEDLATEVAKLVRKYHNAEAPGARPFRLFFGVYPVITKQEEDPRDPVRME